MPEEKESLEKYYESVDRAGKYGVKEELDASERFDEINKIYRSNKEYFGEKVLDLACGGGILGFIVEKDGKNYTGIDLNEEMIERARKFKDKTGSGCKFLHGNVTDVDVQRKFNTITFIGNSIIHFSPEDFIEMIKNIESNSKDGTYFIVEYRDVVKLLAKGEWEDEYEFEENDEAITTLSEKYDTEEGVILQRKKGSDLEWQVGIWSPFMMESIMNLLGWELVKRRTREDYEGFLEVYEKEEKTIKS